MWKLWQRLPAAWRQRLRRLAMASLAVAGLASVAWWLVDGRLAAEARRQADAGLSLAVAEVRNDWTEVILPTAISGEGAAAERAREVAGARVDRAVSAAREGSPATLQRTVRAALEGVRELDTPPTVSGAQWAEWMVRRLTDSLTLLDREDRIDLLIEADATLATLAGRTRRREPTPPITPPSEPEPKVEAPLIALDSAPATTPKPEPTPIEAPPAPPEPMQVAEQPRREPTPPQPQLTVREPKAWSPDWRDATPADPVAEAKEAPSLPQSLTDWTDRQLLAEYVRLTDELSSEPVSASGPTPAPSRDPALKSETELRLEAIGGELTARRFRAVDRRHLDALLSPHTARRVALAERLLTTQTGDTARLLLVLAEDSAPEVRAAAISALGSSSSRPLVRVAWELASQDRDPRVGRLAEPLRQRLR